MELLTKRKRLKTYIGEELKNKYLYFIADENRQECHYIIHLVDISVEEKNVTYTTDKSKVFKVPYDKTKKCYVYDTSDKISINIFCTDIYEITWEEYISLFKSFIEYEDTLSKDIPENLI